MPTLCYAIREQIATIEVQHQSQYGFFNPNTTQVLLGGDTLLSVILYSPLRPFRRCFPGFQILQPVLHCRVWDLPWIKKAFAVSWSAISSVTQEQGSGNTLNIERRAPVSHHIPALRKVISGIAVDLIQIPHPHPSHHARSISVPLSAFCVCVRGWGLVVWISTVLVNRCAECLSRWGLVIIYLFRGCRPTGVSIVEMITYMAPAHLRQSIQSSPSAHPCTLWIKPNAETYDIGSFHSAWGSCTCGGRSCKLR